MLGCVQKVELHSRRSYNSESHEATSVDIAPLGCNYCVQSIDLTGFDIHAVQLEFDIGSQQTQLGRSVVLDCSIPSSLLLYISGISN